jgi:hypothetical protein
MLPAAIVLGMFALFVACDDEAVPPPCTNIPAGGCPSSHGAAACDDPSCEAVYVCLPNQSWQLDHACPARDAATPPDAQPGTTPELDASIDAPPGAYGGPGCEDLEQPDCPLGVALACGAGCCDCQDLYVCEDGGWSFYGTCGDAGAP